LTTNAGFDQAQMGGRHILAYLTRSASDAGQPLVITQQALNTLLGSVVEFPPLEKMDRTLIYVSNQQERPDQGVDIELARDFPLVMARDADEFGSYLELLNDRGLIDGLNTVGGHFRSTRLTSDGWEQVGRIESSLRVSNQAFVAMWFDQSLDETWENGFKPALMPTGFRPYRVGQDSHNEKIDDRIIAEIRRSGIVVADVTGHRPGVYFEAGFAMGLNIPVVWTCRVSDIQDAHFDTRQYNHVVWESPEDLKNKLAYRIAANFPGRQVAG
jgi:hypothetical protein